MLVLSRNKTQKVKFPDLGITVEILEVRGSKVRLGIDAPMEVRVLRDELPDRGPKQPAELAHVMQLPRSLRHELRNLLQELSLLLHVCRDQLVITPDVVTNDGVGIDAEQLFKALLTRLESLGSREELRGGGKTSASRNLDLSKHNTAHAFEMSKSAKVGASLLPSPVKSMESTRCNALVVDDDDNERELLAGFLRMCRFDVDTAVDGENALRLLDECQAPDLILLDLCMPQCDGGSFLRRLRREPRFDNTRVFVVSGSGPDEQQSAPIQGYSHWFSKPLDPNRIVHALDEVERLSLASPDS